MRKGVVILRDLITISCATVLPPGQNVMVYGGTALGPVLATGILNFRDVYDYRIF